MSLPCTSLHMKGSIIGQTEIGFPPFAMEAFQSFGSEIKRIFDDLRCLRSKNFIEFCLNIFVTKSTLDDFARRSNTISAIP